jgi:uncharacterized membrane protein
MIGSATFEDAMENVVRGFEVAGVGVLIVGSVLAFARFVAELFRRRPLEAYKGVRLGVGRAILLGLEILIIADIVQTITIDPTLESTIALGVVVLVRTFLSFSIEIELEGVVPWRRSSAKPGRSV